MERTSFWVPWFVCFCLTLAGCAEIPADNPFDPESPVSVRQPGAVIGRLVAPEGYTESLYTRAAITLTGGQATAGALGPIAAADDGRFRFAAVVSGVWYLRVELTGFEPAERTTVVGIGESLDVGEIRLRPAATVGRIAGEARIGGAAPGQAPTIEVEAEGTPYSTRATESGAFELTVPPGKYRLTGRSPGYGSARSDEVEVGADERVALRSPLVLAALPGRVLGRVVVMGLDGQPRATGDPLLSQVVVEFAPTEGDAPPTPLPVGADGRIDVQNVATGAFALRVRLPGHDSVRRPFDVAPGELVNLGELVLAPTVIGAAPAILVGRVVLTGRDDHTGVTVEAPEHLTATQTRADGSFRLPVVGSVPFTLRVSHLGFRPSEQAFEGFEAGETETLDTPIRLDFVPGGLSGRVVVRPAGLAPRPVDGGTAELSADDGRSLGTTPISAEGGFAFAGVPAGSHALHLSGPRLRATTVQVFIGGDALAALGDVEAAPASGALRGVVTVLGGPAVGEPSVVIEGDPADPWFSGLRFPAAVTAGTGDFEAGGLPVGPYRVTALGRALRPASAEVRISADVDTPVAVDLIPRRFGLIVPATSPGPVTVIVERDEDLSHAQIWTNAPEPPPGLVFERLGAQGTLSVDLPMEGSNVVYARLANEAWADGDRQSVTAFVSPTLSAEVVLDTAPPRLVDVEVDAPGGFVRDAEGRVRVRVVCDDLPAAAGIPRARIEREGAPVQEGPAGDAILVNLGPAEGPRTLDAACRDAAEHVSQAFRVELLVDHTAPALRGLRILDGAVDAVTAAASATVTVDASDDGAGLEAYALRFDAPLDCSQATYATAAEAQVQVPLPAAEGRHTLRACLRDRAGNVSGPFEANDILVDRTPPRLGRVRLADGGTVVRTLDVALEVDGEANAGTLLLGGDLETPREYAPGDWPDAVRLADAEGLHTVLAQVIDDAGNTSAPAVATILVDREPPAEGMLRIAGGAATVNTRTVDVTFLDTTADAYRILERPIDAPCPPMACEGGGFLPFAPSTTVTLSEGIGVKHLCWRLCDAAGNGTPVREAVVELGPYRARPVPVLSTVDPIAITPFDCETPPDEEIRLTLTGRGIAAGTVARIGDFTLPCVVPPAATLCEADANGGCGPGGPCEATCATTCEVALPPGVARASGTYLVRLVTPAPVADGLGESPDVRVFNVAAPQPRLLRLSQRHWLAIPEEDGFVEPETLVLDVQACGLMDNAQFSLGPNTARVLRVEADPDDPRRSVARIAVTTAGIVPTETEDQWLVARNPAPGGGEARARFGMLSPFHAYPSPTVATDLRVTRPPMPHGRGAELALHAHGTVDAGSTWVGRRVVGADSLRLSELPLPVDTPSLGELTLFASLAASPAPPIDVESLRLGRSGPSAGPLRVSPGTFIGGTGRFELSDLSLSRLPTGLADARRVDFDRDGRLDVVAATRAQSGCTVVFGLGDGALGTLISRGCRPSRVLEDGTRTSGPPDALHVVDVDDDGWDDLLAVGPDGTALLHNVRGVPESPQHPPVDVTPEASAVGEVSGERRPDLLVAAEGALHVFTFLLDGTLEKAAMTPLPEGVADATATALALDDLDGDTRPDAVIELSNGDRVTLYGRGDGTFDRPDVAPARGSSRLLLVDLDGDGMVDALDWSPDDLEVTVTWNDGRGRLGPAETAVPVPDGAHDVAVDDPDVDGRPDVLVCDTFAGVVAHRFDRRTRGGPFDVGLGPSGPGAGCRLVTTDLDGNGVVDLVRGDALGQLSTALGVGRGTSGSMENVPQSGAGQVVPVLADLNRDGLTDLVVASAGTGEYPGNLQVRLGDGSGAFPNESVRSLLPNRPYSDVATVDADGDGDLDVVATSFSGHLVLGVNDGTGQLEDFPVDLGAPLQKLSVFGRAGAPVMFIAERQRARIRGISLSFSAGRWTAGNLGSTDHAGTAIVDVVHLDVDRDGFLDQVVCELDTDALLVAHWTPANLDFRRRSVIAKRGRACFALQAGDFDGDGRADLAVSDEAGPHVLWGMPAGGFEIGQPVGETDNVTSMLAFADLNGDGQGDWLTGNASGLTYRLGLGGRQWEEDRAPTTPLLTQPVSAAVGDLDGDGVRDVVWGGFGPFATVWLRQSTRIWPFTFRGVTPGTPRPVGAGAGVTEVHAGQFHQLVQSLSIRVRLEGTDLQDLVLVLVSPRGETVTLEDGARRAGATVWQASYPTVAPGQSMDGLLGIQPQGDWTLRIQNRGRARATLHDFSVLTVGAFQL